MTAIIQLNAFCFVLFLLNFNVHLVSLQDYLYGQSTKSLSYNDFVNKELVLYSNSDNERSIPCLVDGGLNAMSIKKVISNLREKLLLNSTNVLLWMCVCQVWNQARGKCCSVALRGMTSGRWRWPSWLVLWRRCRPTTTERWDGISLITFKKAFCVCFLLLGPVYNIFRVILPQNGTENAYVCSVWLYKVTKN